MASKPLAHCCTVGVKHEGTPTGTIKKVAGVDAYIAEPKGDVIHKEAAILYIPDVIGIWQNSKLMADQFAANGYYTLLLDVLNGDPVPLNRDPSFDIAKWRAVGSDGKTPHTVEAVDPLVEAAIKHLRDDLGFKKIGSVGYCFGAKFLVRFMAEGKGIDTGFVAHPTFVSEEELAAIKGPLSIAAAEVDHVFPEELRHKSEKILIEKGYPFLLTLYSSVKHGFAVRCDLANKQERFAKEQAFLQAVTWFNEYLVN